MCRGLVLFLVLWNTIRSQPITDELDQVRAPRQLDLECCPCTGPRAGLRAGEADDCPCLRDADSQSSPSFFLPRALRPDLRPADPKEDHKPLLHPEVDLASSVLETLREVTDEEYQEAVARDAARSADKSSEPDLIIRDSIPEPTKNIVTIILNPKQKEDGLVSEASNLQEARYIHPFENPSDNLERVVSNRPQNLLKEIFNLAKPKVASYNNVKDMKSDASNVQERVENINRGLQGLKLKTNPHVFNLFPSKIKPIDRNLKSSFMFRDVNKNMKSTDKDCENANTNLNTNVPDFRFNENTNQGNTEEGLRSNKIDNTLLSKIRYNQSQRSKSNSFSNIDNSASTSNVVDQLFEHTKGQDARISRLKTHMPTSDINTKKPFGIQNLLKLSDVELITPKSNKAKITIPSLKLPPTIQSSRKKTDLNSFANGRGDANNFNDCDEDIKEKSNLSKEFFTKNKSLQTEILDAVPSPSENKPIVTVPNNSMEVINHLDKLNPKDNSITTDILDAVPSPSQKHQVVSVKEDNLDTSIAESGENFAITTNPTDSDISQNSQEMVAINTSKNPEEGLEIDDFDNDNIKTIEIEDGNLDTLLIENETSDDITDVESNELIIEDSSENQEFESPIFVEGLQDESEINNVDLIQDSVPDTSNDATLILPQEEIEINVEETSSENNFRAAEPCQNDHQDLGSNTTPVALKTSNTNTEEPTQFERNSNGESSESISNENVDINCQDELSITTTLLLPISTSGKADESTENTNQVNIKDLQKLSNSILDMSIRKNLNHHSARTIECDTTTQENLRSNEIIENEADNSSDSTDVATENTDLESSATSPQIEILDTPTNSIELTEELSQSNEKNPTRQNIDLTNVSHENENIQGNGCISNLLSKNDDKETRPNVHPNEMTAEASAPVMNIIPQATSKAFKNSDLKSSMLQDIIMQPSSLFEENNLFRRPLPNIGSLLNSNTQLPTIDDIQSSIPSILGGSERHVDEDEFSSTETDNNIDCSNSNPVMSSDSSTTNSKRIFPALKPLENINLDIFQLNPLTQARIPSLNLNSYKAKLALPKSLDLKPIRLQSSLGKNGGLLGATLTFGPDKIGSARNIKPNAILNRKGPNVLKSRLGDITNLNDLRAAMKSNAKNLLKSPLMFPGDNLRSRPINALSANFKSHTANTMKNIQQTLASTLNEAIVKDNKFAKPQDLLEMVSVAHDDVSDKLQAIHTDLTDRLTSLHESIVDQSKLPSLQTPVIKDTRRNLKPKAQSKPENFLKTSQSSLSPKPRGYRGNTKDVQFGSTHARTVTEPNNFKPFKISKAASSLAPKSVEVPKLTTTSSKPLFSKPLQRDTQVKLKESKPIGITKEPMRPQDIKVINKFKPFGESKVKVMISTTARPSSKTILDTKPISLSPKPRIGAKTSQFINDRLKAIPKSNHVINKPITLRQNSKPNTDSKGFASEIRPSILPMPMKPNNSPKSSKTDTEAMTPKGRSSPIRQNLSISEGIKPTPPLLKNSFGSSTPQLTSGSFKPELPTVSDSLITKTKNEETPRNIKPQRLVLPKATDDAFLSKVREALKAKFPKLNVNKPIEKPIEKVRTSSTLEPLGSEDMVRSASENKEVALVDEKPVKENVSYRCRMVCVREPIEP